MSQTSYALLTEREETTSTMKALVFLRTGSDRPGNSAHPEAAERVEWFSRKHVGRTTGNVIRLGDLGGLFPDDGQFGSILADHSGLWPCPSADGPEDESQRTDLVMIDPIDREVFDHAATSVLENLPEAPLASLPLSK